jgi:hypothetical protein
VPKRNFCKYFKTSAEIIRLAVMMYIWFPLSVGSVEDLLRKRDRDCTSDINNLVVVESWISDPPSPPLAPAKTFSRSGCGRIFSLFSKVMRDGLSPGACKPGSSLSWQVFSGPDDCANLVQSLQTQQQVGFHMAST